ncbi:hypothetical protein LPJ61_003930, partial [Coemansia biformis]
PNETERARMDAWVEDDDEFSPGDYDLSGTYFELASASTCCAASAGVSDTAYGGIPWPENQASPTLRELRAREGGQCTTPKSRVSSTSTVVDDSALSPEQYRRIVMSSARKLQWQCRRREMSSIVHVRNIMAKASERYVETSGGRPLDAPLEPGRLVADICAYGGTAPAIAHQQRDGIMPAAAAATQLAPVSPLQGDSAELAYAQPPSECADADAATTTDADAEAGGLFPARIRSMECLPLLLHLAKRSSPTADEMRVRTQKRAAIADGSEPVYDGEHWPSTGDLVSLDPAGPARSARGGGSSGSPRTAYRPYRRRRRHRGGRRSATSPANSALVLC